MRITPSLTTLAKLEGWCAAAGGREVSGLCVVDFDVENQLFLLIDAYLLDVGNSVYTEITSQRIVDLHATGVDPHKLKCWWHCHPLGDGEPGPNNWSNLDERTALKEPLGSDPKWVKWSVAIVRTPYGWVGRLDDHLKQETYHLPVDQVLSRDDYQLIYPINEGRSEPVKQLDQPLHQSSLVENLTFGFGEAGKSSRGIDPVSISEAKDLLRSGLPEEVAFVCDLSIKTLYELGLISIDEWKDACRRAGQDEA